MASPVTLFPTSDITKEWGPTVGTHYDLVDDPGTHDGDTTKISASSLAYGDDLYGLTDWPDGDVTITKVEIVSVAKNTGNNETYQPFLVLSSTTELGSSFNAGSSYAEDTQDFTSKRPGGGSWVYTDFDGLQLGLRSQSNFGKGKSVTVTLGKVVVTYSAGSPDHLAPTSLQCDRQTNPSGVGDSPIFTAIFNAYNDTGTANRYQVQVSKVADFASTVWDSSEQTLSPTCSDNARCTEIAYGGSALESDVTYYWRIKLYSDTQGGTFSTGGTFSGIDRDWEDAEFPLRYKITVETDHLGIATGQLLALDLQTGHRIIVATDGAFDEAVQASGGFSMVRYANKTHIFYLSKIEADGNLGIRVVSLDHVTGERGASVLIDTSGTDYDTHYFPTCEVNSTTGHLHCFYGCHNNALRYRRTKYPNETGSLSTDHDPATNDMWIRPDTGADGYMTPTGASDATYPIGIHIPSGQDAGRIYVLFRYDPAYQYRFCYTDDDGETWNGAYIFAWDTLTGHYRLYMYGVRYDRNARRLHISWTHNLTGDAEQGIWYAYCDYDATRTGAADVGFNVFKWADGTEAGYVDSGNTGAYAIDRVTAKAIMHRDDENSLIFSESMVLTGAGDPVVIWEMKLNQGSNLWSNRTNLVCAKWNGSSWDIYLISDQTNTMLRVRRSSVSANVDEDGIIRMLVPVSSVTYWNYLPTIDVDDVGVVRSTGSDNYALLDDGFTRYNTTGWIKLNTNTDKLSMRHSTSDPDDITKIFAVEVVAIMTATGAAGSARFYLNNGSTNQEASSSQSVSQFTTDRYVERWEQSPFTSSDWAESELTNLRLGLRSDSSNELQIYTMWLRVEFTRATDENYGATEIHELTSSDDGETWVAKERSRNSMIGVPMMNHMHHSGGVFEAMWTSGNDIFYFVDKTFGLVLPTGVDARILWGSTEIARVANYWNLADSRIAFKAQEAITAGEPTGTKDYYLEIGNWNVADQPEGAPGSIWQGFWNWEEMDAADGIGTHADWTVVAGAAEVYDAHVNHRNKVYAGVKAMKSTSHAFEAKALIGTDVADVFIGAGIWLEGSSGQCYIAARDGASNEFRVGINPSTDRPAYYDGTWHDVTTFYALRANMNTFALLVTSAGVSAWVNGVRIVDENNTLVDVDEIRIGCASESYFDLIRWSYRDFATKSTELTTGFDRSLASYDADDDATLEGTDAYHEIGNATAQEDRVKKIIVKVQAKHGTGSPGTSVTSKVRLANVLAWDGSGVTDTDSFEHSVAGSWADEHTYTFADLEPGNYSVKLDCIATDGVPDDEAQCQFSSIEYFYDSIEPVLVLGSLESRGFRMDFTLQGANVFDFVMDFNTDAQHLRSDGLAAIEATGGKAAPGLANVENSQNIAARGAVLFAHSGYLTAYAQCLLESLRGMASQGVAPAAWTGQPTIIQNCSIETIAGLSTRGQATVDFQRGHKAHLMSPVETGLAVNARGQVVLESSGAGAFPCLAVVESLHAIDTEVAMPHDFLAACLSRGQAIVDFGKGHTSDQVVLLAYSGYISSIGVFNLDHLVLLNVRRVANLETIAGMVGAAGMLPFEYARVMTPGRCLLPLSFVSQPVVTAQTIFDFGRQATSNGSVVFDTGQAVASHGQVAFDNLATLLTDCRSNVSWMGTALLQGVGSVVLEWKGGVAVQAQNVVDNKGALAGARGGLVLDFKGGVAVRNQGVLESLASHKSHQVGNVDTGAGRSATTQAVLGHLAGRRAQELANVESLGGVKAEGRGIFESLANQAINQAGNLDFGARVVAQAAALAEWGRGRQFDTAGVLDWRQAISSAGRFPEDWTSGATLTSFGLFPIDWRTSLSSSGEVTFDFGTRSLLEAIAPFEYGAGHASQHAAPYTVDALARIVCQTTLDTIKELQGVGQFTFDTGAIVESVAQAQFEAAAGLLTNLQAVEDWVSYVGFRSIGSFPMSWRASFAAALANNIDHKKAIQPVGANLIIDWTHAMDPAASAAMPNDWGQGVQVVANALSSWLGSIGVYGKMNVNWLGAHRSEIQIDIEWGAGMITRTVLPYEVLRGLLSVGQGNAEWAGFAVTMFTVLWAEARIPGVVGATAKIPGVGQAVATVVEAANAEARTASASYALAKIVDAMNAHIRGGG